MLKPPYPPLQVPEVPMHSILTIEDGSRVKIEGNDRRQIPARNGNERAVFSASTAEILKNLL